MNYDDWKTTEPPEERGNPDWYCPECDMTWDKCKCEPDVEACCGHDLTDHDFEEGCVSWCTKTTDDGIPCPCQGYKRLEDRK